MGNLELHDKGSRCRDGEQLRELVSILSRSSAARNPRSRPRDTPPPATRENNAKLIFACLNLMTSRFDTAAVLRVFDPRRR